MTPPSYPFPSPPLFDAPITTESHDQHMTTHQLNGIVDSDISSPDVPTNPLKTSPMRLSPSDYHTPPVMNSDDTADMKRGQLDSDQGDSSADTEEIVCKWKKLLGPEYEVKVSGYVSFTQ